MKFQISHIKYHIILLFCVYCLLGISFGCGYRVVGSRHLPFHSVTIKPIQNKTYEPGLEDRLHRALSEEFLAQGISVITSKGNVTMETAITTFELGAIAAINENVQEQTITMKVDVKIIDGERVIEFSSMESPIRITFQTAGTVTDSVMQKEKAIEKASQEIASEIVGKMVLRYAE